MTLRRGACLVAALASAFASGCDDLKSVANPEVPLWVHHPGSAMSVTQRRELTAVSRREGAYV